MIILTYTNGIGILKDKYIYQVDNPDTAENEERSIQQVQYNNW